MLSLQLWMMILHRKGKNDARNLMEGNLVLHVPVFLIELYKWQYLLKQLVRVKQSSHAQVVLCYLLPDYS